MHSPPESRKFWRFLNFIVKPVSIFLSLWKIVIDSTE